MKRIQLGLFCEVGAAITKNRRRGNVDPAIVLSADCPRGPSAQFRAGPLNTAYRAQHRS